MLCNEKFKHTNRAHRAGIAFQVGGIQLRQVSRTEYMFAIPNGGYRHYRTAADLKSEGVKSGVPDIMLPVARGGYYGLFIEMKRTSGGRVSESQQKFLKTLNDNGYLAVVCKGFEQAQEAILKYLNKGVRK